LAFAVVMRVSSVMVLALGVAAHEEDTAMLQVKGDYGDYHADVVLPDPVWLRYSEDSELVIRHCHAQGAKKCSSFDGGKAFMDSMKDDSVYGFGIAHYGKHCCVEKVKQCETTYVTHCKRQNAKDLTEAQCKKVAEQAKSLSFWSVVQKKNQFPGCYYRKADGKTFWNSFVAEEGYSKGDGSHGDRKVYAPICRVRRCKSSKTEYKEVVHPKVYKKVVHPKGYKKVVHPNEYKKLVHPKEYKQVVHPKGYKKAVQPKAYKKAEHPKGYKKAEHPKKYTKVDAPMKYKKVEERHYHN